MLGFSRPPRGGSIPSALEDDFGGPAARAFLSALRFSGKGSVDAFLEHRPDLIEIGKYAIALALLRFEVPNAVFAPQQSWYEYLFNRLNATIDEFSQNRLGVITFNYDRSLEWYLHTALKNSYKLGADEARNALDAITFIHVHGSLGALPWQGGVRDFGDEEINSQSIQRAASTIKIIHEDVTDTEEFRRAQNLLGWAETEASDRVRIRNGARRAANRVRAPWQSHPLRGGYLRLPSGTSEERDAVCMSDSRIAVPLGHILRYRVLSASAARSRPGTSLGSSSPWRRQPTRRSQVRARATSRRADAATLPPRTSVRQPSNQHAELAGSSGTAAATWRRFAR
jgi:hypothetical protein